MLAGAEGGGRRASWRNRLPTPFWQRPPEDMPVLGQAPGSTRQRGITLGLSRRLTPSLARRASVAGRNALLATPVGRYAGSRTGSSGLSTNRRRAGMLAAKGVGSRFRRLNDPKCEPASWRNRLPTPFWQSPPEDMPVLGQAPGSTRQRGITLGLSRRLTPSLALRARVAGRNALLAKPAENEPVLGQTHRAMEFRTARIIGNSATLARRRPSRARGCAASLPREPGKKCASHRQK